MAQPDENLCPGTAIAEGQTDANGVVRLAAVTCGKAKIVVAYPGLATQRPEVETCDGPSVHVQLAKAPPPPDPVDACGRDALQFLSAWITGDDARASERYADESHYYAYAARYPELKPWAVRIDSSRVSGERCRVSASLFLPIGCEDAYVLELEQSERGWLIRDIPPAK